VNANDAGKRQVWSAAEYLTDFTRLLSANSESYEFFQKKLDMTKSWFYT